jgi:hypothetical protein
VDEEVVVEVTEFIADEGVVGVGVGVAAPVAFVPVVLAD